MTVTYYVSPVRLFAFLVLLPGASNSFPNAIAPPSHSQHAHQRRRSLPLLHASSSRRRQILTAAAAGPWGLFGRDTPAATPTTANTNQVVRTVQGIRYKRLGGTGDIVVSEMGLGTQRWMSTDFNAPDRDLCFALLDRAIGDGYCNLIDTAEQYPIPSDGVTKREGDTERVIGEWMQSRRFDREKVVIATKITGGRRVTPATIRADCEGSLKRLGTDYIDVYQLHWPQRYSPQSNWGQSLTYYVETERAWRKSLGEPTSFADLCQAMQELIDEGKIRGWGLCNDNAYGLTASTKTASALGTTPPCCLQGDFSLIDRKSEENGVAEAASPFNENVGFLSYNALAGGMLTGKYLDTPAAPDVPTRAEAMTLLEKPRGRMDTRGWGGTLYRYRTTAAQAAIREYQEIVQRHRLKSLTELALRWNRQRSLVTSTLVGHTTVAQLDECLSYFRNPKPLSDEIMWEIDRVHMKNRLPIFSSDQVGADWFGEGEIGETIP